MEDAKFCPRCGARVAAGAQFCTACGADLSGAADGRHTVPAGDAHIATGPVPGGAHASAAHHTASAAEASSKATRKMPRAAILGIAGVATAAVVALGATGIFYATSGGPTPTAPVANGSAEPAVSDTAADAAGDDATDSGDAAMDAAPQVPEATGAPAHFMQLAELLAMDSSKLDGFLIDQGLYRYTGGDSTLDNQLNGNLDIWLYGGAAGNVLRSTLPEAQINGDELSSLEEDGAASQGFFSMLSGYLITDLQFGADGCTMAYGQVTDQMTGQEVSRGQTPACVVLPALPISWLSGDELGATARDLFGFLGEGDRYEASASFADDGMRTRTACYQGVAGSERVGGADGIWFVYQSGVDDANEPSGVASQQTAAGFVFLSEAAKIVEDTGLYSEQEWTAADAKTQREMFLQSYIQNAGDLDTNLRTGQVRLIESGDSSRWVTLEEYEEEAGSPRSPSAMTFSSESIVDYAQT